MPRRALPLPSLPAAPSVFSVCGLGVSTLLLLYSKATQSACFSLCANSSSETDGLGGYRIQNRQPYGIELSLLASVVLGGASIPRALRLKKPVPILLSVLSTFGAITFGSAYKNSL